MRSLLSFIKKEWMEHFRSGRLLILGMIFVLFGIMNPAIAKLTPWLMETMADSLAESGLIVSEVKVTALDSWMQFYKNAPMALIVFVLMESSNFTKEYQSGTLVLALTKGLERYKVVVAKSFMLFVMWTIGYWLCFGITYSYNVYFWDNSIAENLMFSVVCWWIFGLWVISLLVLFSVLMDSNGAVLCGTGAVAFGLYLLGLFKKIKEYLPTLLMDGNSLIYGVEEAERYYTSLAVAGAMSLACLGLSIIVFNKKKI